MPKRKLLKPSEETLAAVKSALTRPRAVTVSEQRRLDELRATGAVRVQDSNVFVTEQAGQLVFRKGTRKWQRGSVEHPETLKNQRKERDFLSDQVKKLRVPPVEAASRARTARARRPEVERLLSKYGLRARSTCKKVADELGLSQSYVRQIRNQMTLTESHYREP